MLEHGGQHKDDNHREDQNPDGLRVLHKTGEKQGQAD